jgi:hypothetical protein
VRVVIEHKNRRESIFFILALNTAARQRRNYVTGKASTINVWWTTRAERNRQGSDTLGSENNKVNDNVTETEQKWKIGSPERIYELKSRMRSVNIIHPRGYKTGIDHHISVIDGI